MADMLKVSANSRTTAVAGAVAGVIRNEGKAEMQAIGAAAVNQMVKAIAIARGYLQQDGLDLAVVPTFSDVEINGEQKTAVKLFVESRDREFGAQYPTPQWKPSERAYAARANAGEFGWVTVGAGE